MFIFDQPYQYFEEPWPHIVIENVLPEDVADHMLHNWPDIAGFGPRFLEFGGFGIDTEDPILLEFERVNFFERADDILKMSAEIFKDELVDDCDLDGFMYKDHKYQTPTLIRDWHTDNPNKKYNGILYIGSGPNAQFVAKNKKTKIEKTYEYEHNRLIWWRSNSESWHKFYSGVGSRKTMSISADFKINPKGKEKGSWKEL